MNGKTISRLLIFPALLILPLASCRGGETPTASGTTVGTETETDMPFPFPTTPSLTETETESAAATSNPGGYELKDWREPMEVITPDNVNQVEKIGELEFNDTVFNFAWSPDGSKLAVSLLDYRLYVIDAIKYFQIYLLQGGYPAFSYDGRILEVGGSQYDLATGEKIPVEDVTLRSVGYGFSDVEFSPNGDYVIGVGREYIYFYPMKPGLNTGYFTREGAEPLYASFNSDGKYLVVNYRYEEFTELWDVYERIPARFLKLRGIRGIKKPKFSHGGNSVFILGIGDWANEKREFIQEWNYITGDPLNLQIVLGIGNTGSNSMDVSPVSSVIALGMHNGKIYLLPFHDCKAIEVEVTNISDSINKIAFRPDGKMFSTMRNSGNKIDFWGIPENKEKPTLGPTEEKTELQTPCPIIPMITEQPVPNYKWLAQ